MSDTPAQPAVFYYSTAQQLEDAELWFGPHASREIAAEKCRTRWPDVGFWIAEGRAQANRLDVIDRGLFQPDGLVGQSFDLINEELIGEGGEGGSWEWSPDAIDTLVQRLNVQFAAWATEHGYQRGWTLDLTAEEWTPAQATVPEEARNRPMLSLAGSRP